MKSVLCWVLVASLAFPPPMLMANPQDGTVMQGAASITSSGSTTTINQTTNRAIIHWQRFSINQGETTQFKMPNSSSAVLNRVTGQQISTINGTLSSNGHVYLVNPNGIIVGPSGVINTNSFVASTLNIPDNDFMDGGDLTFQGSSKQSLLNYGTITALEGDIYLIGASVENHGSLNAPNGTVGLGAGLNATIVDGGHPSLVVRATDQSLSNVGVLNSGSINALQAELIANGSNVFGLAINNTGTVRATGYEQKGGRVFLVADGGSIESSGELVAKRDQNGGDVIAFTGGEEGTSVEISGVVDVSGVDKGGTLYVKAGQIDLSQADIFLNGAVPGQLLLSVGPHTVNIFEGVATGNFLGTDDGVTGSDTSDTVYAQEGSGMNVTNVLKITTVDGESSLQGSGNQANGDHDLSFSGFVIESADPSNPYISNIEFNLDKVGPLPNEADIDNSTVTFEVLVREPDGTTSTNTFSLTYQQLLDLQQPDGGDSSNSRVLLQAENGELIEKITVTSVLLNDAGNPINLEGDELPNGDTVNFLNQIKQFNSVELVEEDPAILTIRKFVNGDQSQSFEFYLNEGDTSDKDDSPSMNDIIEMFELVHNDEINRILDPGEYTVDEVVPDGWFTSIEAFLESDPNSSVDLADADQGIAVVTLASGETVILEYTNTEGGTIVVAKEVLGDANQQFNFVIKGTDDVMVASDTLKGGQMFSSGPLMPGEYTIKELLGALGTSGEWVTSIKIGDGEFIPVSPDADGNVNQTVTLGAGETVTVTYRNVQQGQINVTKTVVSTEENSGQTFKFEIRDSDGNLVSDGFLGHGDDLNTGFIPPGEYSVEELLAMSSLTSTVPDEWKVEVTVQGETGPPTTYTQGDLVTLGAGETLNFEFTNTQLGKLVITKVTTIDGEPGSSTTSFMFEVEEQTGAMGDRVMLDFSLTGGETHTLYLEAGNYTVQELLGMLPEGWTLTDLDVVGKFIPGQSDLENGIVTVNMGDGRQANTVELTFTNNFETPIIPPGPEPLAARPILFQYIPIYPRGTGEASAEFGDDEERPEGEVTGNSSFQLFGSEEGNIPLGNNGQNTGNNGQ